MGIPYVKYEYELKIDNINGFNYFARILMHGIDDDIILCSPDRSYAATELIKRKYTKLDKKFLLVNNKCYVDFYLSDKITKILKKCKEYRIRGEENKIYRDIYYTKQLNKCYIQFYSEKDYSKFKLLYCD